MAQVVLWMWQLAVVLYEPAAATIYAAAFVRIVHGMPAIDQLADVAPMIMALPALLRLMMQVPRPCPVGAEVRWPAQAWRRPGSAVCWPRAGDAPPAGRGKDRWRCRGDGHRDRHSAADIVGALSGTGAGAATAMRPG